MLQTPAISILCIVAASLLGAVGQYLFKAGAGRPADHALGFLMSPWVWLGMGCYLTVMLLFSHAFRRGGAVTVLYPVYATTFIWAAVIGWVFHGQPIRLIHVLGMEMLLGGMYLMAVGNAEGV